MPGISGIFYNINQYRPMKTCLPLQLYMEHLWSI